MNKFLRALAIGLLLPCLANAISQGPNTAGTGTDDSSFGTTSWLNPGNITLSDNTYATAATIAGVNTHYLTGTNFGFSLPANAVIAGILVEWERKAAAGAGGTNDSRVRIVKGGAAGSTDRSAGASWTSSDSFVPFGSNADLWGETWTASDINSSNFGAAISPQGVSGGATASVDSVRITVYYTSPINQSFPVDLDQVLN